MKKGFTLIELLAVIVILAIIALIATPIVLGIIDDTKESAQIRSAEMYLKGVANAVMKENLEQEGNFRPTECSITNEGNLDCDDKEGILEIDVDGEKPKNRTITFTEGKIKEVRLEYQNSIILKNEEGNLVYEGSSSNQVDMSTVSATLEKNDWETIQKVVSAGKVSEAGWSVGDTKEVEINGETKTATIIGLDHDGENTATFMVMENLGDHRMNSTDTNAGGWEASEMRTWLNNDIYNSMSNKAYIKEVTKMTDNVGYKEDKINTTDDVTGTQDKIFLLSAVETGSQSQVDNWSYQYINQINAEGTTYEWFKTNSLSGTWFWLRSPYAFEDYGFFFYESDMGILHNGAECDYPVFPAFVIGK